MHYYDKEHLENNILEIMVYTHGMIGKSGVHEIHITSIKKCKYFHPTHLKQVLEKPKKLFKNLKKITKLEVENFYLVSLKEIGERNGFNYDIVKIEKISKDKDCFYYLH